MSLHQHRVGGVEVEKFRATGGRVTSAVGLVLAGVVVTIGLVELDRGFPPWVIAFAALFAVLVWAAILRPGLELESDTLVMRNMFETVSIPLAGVEELAVRQVLAVRAGDRRHVSTVVGRTWRKAALGRPKASAAGEKAPDQMAYADFVEERLRQRVEDARAAAGVRPGSPEQLALADGVRRQPAWLPIGIVSVASLAFVVALLL